MNFPRILHTDLSTYTFYASGSDVVGHELYNLYNYIPSASWKGGDTGSALQYFTIDVGDTTSRDCISIDYHNFGTLMSGSGTIKLERATNATFTTDLEEVGLYYNLYNSNIFTELPPSTKRYYRLVFNGNLTKSIEIGNIFIDNLMKFNLAYIYGYKNNNYVASSTEFTTLGGIKRNIQAYATRLISEFNFKLVNDATRNRFIEFVKSVKGRAIPFYFADSDAVVIYANLANDYTPADVMSVGLNEINNLSFVGNMTNATLELAIPDVFDDDMIL